MILDLSPSSVALSTWSRQSFRLPYAFVTQILTNEKKVTVYSSKSLTTFDSKNRIKSTEGPSWIIQNMHFKFENMSQSAGLLTGILCFKDSVLRLFHFRIG